MRPLPVPKTQMIASEQPLMPAPNRFTHHLGHTFEWEFDLPMPTNPAYQEPPETTRKAKKTRKSAINITKTKTTVEDDAKLPRYDEERTPMYRSEKVTAKKIMAG